MAVAWCGGLLRVGIIRNFDAGAVDSGWVFGVECVLGLGELVWDGTCLRWIWWWLHFGCDLGVSC